MTKLNDAVLLLADRISELNIKPTSASKLIKRVTVEIEPVDLLDWLSARQQHHKIYWRDRDSDQETAGVGAAAVYYIIGPDRYQQVFDHLNRYQLESDSINFYGGFSFQPDLNTNSEDTGWSQFYDAYFFLPRFELCKSDDKAELAANLLIDPSRPEEINNVITQLHLGVISEEGTETAPIKMTDRRDLPGFDGWCNRIKQAVDFIQKGDLKKIVLARRTVLEFDGVLNPWGILKKLG